MNDETEVTLAADNVVLSPGCALGIPVEAEVGTPGTHTWAYWQRELHHAWPLLVEHLHIATLAPRPDSNRTVVSPPATSR